MQEFTCSTETVDDLAGPGRAVDKLFGYPGHHLELFLGEAGEASVRMGKGPIATAARIRRNLTEIIAMKTWVTLELRLHRMSDS